MTNIRVFECSKNDSPIIKYVYNESANFIESFDVDFEINEPSNLTETVLLIGTEGSGVLARLLFSRDYLTPRICSC